MNAAQANITVCMDSTVQTDKDHSDVQVLCFVQNFDWHFVMSVLTFLTMSQEGHLACFKILQQQPAKDSDITHEAVVATGLLEL